MDGGARGTHHTNVHAYACACICMHARIACARTGSEEDDGRLCRRDRAERASALGVAVQLCDDDGADLDGLLEGLGLVVRRLADAAVHHKDDEVGVDGRGHLLELLEQRRVLLVPAARVDDDQVPPLLLEAQHALLRNHGRVGLAVGAVEGDGSLGRVLCAGAGGGQAGSGGGGSTGGEGGWSLEPDACMGETCRMGDTHNTCVRRSYALHANVGMHACVHAVCGLRHCPHYIMEHAWGRGDMPHMCSTLQNATGSLTCLSWSKAPARNVSAHTSAGFQPFFL